VGPELERVEDLLQRASASHSAYLYLSSYPAWNSPSERAWLQAGWAMDRCRGSMDRLLAFVDRTFFDVSLNGAWPLQTVLPVIPGQSPVVGMFLNAVVAGCSAQLTCTL
jgi:hypothetical protein